MAINLAMRKHAEKFGLDCVDTGLMMGEEEARNGAGAWNQWHLPIRKRGSTRSNERSYENEAESYRAFFGACEEADLLICSSVSHLGAIAEKVVGIQRVTVTVSTAVVCRAPTDRKEPAEDAASREREEIIRRHRARFLQGLKPMGRRRHQPWGHRHRGKSA